MGLSVVFSAPRDTISKVRARYTTRNEQGYMYSQTLGWAQGRATQPAAVKCCFLHFPTPRQPPARPPPPRIAYSLPPRQAHIPMNFPGPSCICLSTILFSFVTSPLAAPMRLETVTEAERPCRPFRCEYVKSKSRAEFCRVQTSV